MHWSGPFLLLLAYNACLINFLSAKSANYYETLGVQKSASAREIKRAFRKMALKYHPDKNNGDPDAEKKFVEVAKAYEILSDTDKRNQYDQFGEAAFDNQGPSESPFNFNDFFKDFDSFFADMDIHQHGTDNIFNDFLVEDDDDDGGDDDDDVFGSPFGGVFDHFDDFGGFEDHSHHHSQHNHQHQSVHDMNSNKYMRRSSSSRSHGGQHCKTVTKRVGNMVSTHTVCS